APAFRIPKAPTIAPGERRVMSATGAALETPRPIRICASWFDSWSSCWYVSNPSDASASAWGAAWACAAIIWVRFVAVCNSRLRQQLCGAEGTFYWLKRPPHFNLAGMIFQGVLPIGGNSIGLAVPD